MKTAVVLGMHRSGTSLVASMLHALGVDMGKVMFGPNATQPFGHWEDLDFVRMSNEILADAGGTWDNPPELDYTRFRPELAMLATVKKRPEIMGGEKREGEWWGWKDPRTCLTIGCYHQYLDHPHYIVVDRDKEAIVDSLEWREGKAGDRWGNLTDLYISTRDFFLDNVESPRIRIQYEDILDDPLGEAWRLASFLGIDDEIAVQKAAAQVRTGGTSTDEPLPEAIWATLATLEVTQDKLNIIHLGERDDELRGSVQNLFPTCRFVNIHPDWAGAWNTIHGELHCLIVTPPCLGKSEYAQEVCRWAAKVRPGGAVVGQHLDVIHDWQKTTWHRSDYCSSWKRYDRRPFLRRGDGFGSLGVGVPYHKSVYDFWRWFSWVLIRGLDWGDEFLNDETVRAPLPIPLVHNRLMARFLETDRDTLCIVEDDHVGDVDVIRRMREKAENFDYDIVCANYVNRREFPSLTGYGIGGKAATGEIICVLNWDDTSRTGTEAVDGAAMGLVLIRRWVLDAMMAGGKPAETFWCEWVGGNSQDIVFYDKARRIGARAAVDRDANIGHIAQVVRTVDDFWKYREGL